MRSSSARPLPERIRALVDGELYGVLCTQGSEQPYGSLVAFAFGPDKALATSAANVRGQSWAHLVDLRANLDGGKVERWQVTLEVAFLVEPSHGG